MKNVIEINKLTKDYQVGFWKTRSQRVLDELSLEVQQGEVFGFLGGNGAGKTTTIKLLMRLIFPSAGTAQILGHPLGDMRINSNIGYLPESPYFYDYLTAQELLDYCGKIFGMSKDRRVSRIKELLKLVDIEEAANLQLRKYSKGMLQRVGIAQSLINDPQIVFMDEPMSGLDPIGRREVRDIIHSLHERGKTVFFSTHILSDVEVLCDRVAILRKGKLAGYGKLSELQTQRDHTLEMVVQGIKEADINTLKQKFSKIKTTPSGLNIQLPNQSYVDEALALIRPLGGQLISVAPLKAALEDFFVKD